MDLIIQRTYTSSCNYFIGLSESKGDKEAKTIKYTRIPYQNIGKENFIYTFITFFLRFSRLSQSNRKFVKVCITRQLASVSRCVIYTRYVLSLYLTVAKLWCVIYTRYVLSLYLTVAKLWYSCFPWELGSYSSYNFQGTCPKVKIKQWSYDFVFGPYTNT